MVSVRKKRITHRIAVAEAIVSLKPETLALIVENRAPKGDVLAVARIAGIQAAKRTHELIPLCHALALTSIEIDFDVVQDSLRIRATAECDGKTGVEMEALTAATVAGLTIYDMLKAVERGIEIGQIGLLEKSGGRSGHWKR